MDRKETIYIAGPEIFFEGGVEVLASLRKISEANGHSVSLPNDTPLKQDFEDKRKNADEIFDNLKEIIFDTTMIISDLDEFRGSEADSGTIFEIGMGHALKLLNYGYTKDMRPLVWKDQKIEFKDGINYDEHELEHHYSFLPFSPMIMASTKIVEGEYTDVLRAYDSDNFFGFNDIFKNVEEVESNPKNIFVSYRNYYNRELLDQELSQLKDLEDAGFNIVEPYFVKYENSMKISDWLEDLINENTKRIDSCEIFVGDYNNYRGFENSNDVAFLSGYAFQKGKKMYGYMDDARPMIDKIPNIKKDGKYKDQANRDVENFNYPINLMFASCTKIVEGDLKELNNVILERDK